jgi:hypothetical protein
LKTLQSRVLLLLVLFTVSFASLHLPYAVADTSANIDAANASVQKAFTAVYAAEKTGGNITQLLSDLNTAGALLAESENAYNSGNLTGASAAAGSASSIAVQVATQANALTNVSQIDGENMFWLTVGASTVGGAVFLSVLLLVEKRIAAKKPRRYRTIFFAVGLVGILIFASPTISLYLKLPSSEPFSTVYFLGPDQTFNSIPFNVKSNVTYTVYLGIENHEGAVGYYEGLVKLRNDTEPLPNATLGAPSTLPVVYQYNVFLLDGQAWEAPLKFRINSVNTDGLSQIQSITINNIDFTVNKTAAWDSEDNGFYYELFAELWAFNPSDSGFHFDNRCVHFYLNVTAA